MNSSIRKRAISGWLKKYHTEDFSSALKLQKFLFFYEILSKIENDDSELCSLKGYTNGPVFSDVYGDYRYRKDDFFSVVEKSFIEYPEKVNNEIAKVASFLVNILEENELSEFTHQFHIWKVKEEQINGGVKDVPLSEGDLNEEDIKLFLTLKNMYPVNYIDSVDVINISKKIFIINKQDIPKLTDKSRNVFTSLAKEKDLQNPVYISILDNGVILVD